MFTKVQIFNLALSALLLNKRITDTDADVSIENRTLNLVYDIAKESTLQDLDLNKTSSQADLELIIKDPNKLWKFAYKYPNSCAFFRRIQSCVVKDVRSTKIPFITTNYEGDAAIFTNEEQAIGEFIANDVPLKLLSANAGLAVAYKLASLAAPLVSGKGALTLRKDIDSRYLLYKAEAQEVDRLENNNFDSDQTQSEFVLARTT